MASPVKKRKRNPNFRIEFAGDDGQKQSVLESFQRIRSELSSKLNKPVGNLQVIETLFQLWSNKAKESENELAEKEKPSVPSPRIKKRRTARQCRFLPESDRKCLAKARQIQDISDTDSDIEDTKETHTFEPTVICVSNLVSIRVAVFERLPPAHPRTLNF
uniref:Uncharacterized protein n=1 Tax=Magallana gigas TaxID=29159 RepID=A0A8W8JZV3_MAGGI